MQKCGQKWSALSETEKEPYTNKANEDKERYRREIQEEMNKNGGKKLPTPAEAKKMGHVTTQ